MTTMSAERWAATAAYLQELAGEDEHLATLMRRAEVEGLPSIAITAEVGRLLKLLTTMTNAGAGAQLAIEVGTLAGYSAIWIARGLRRGGKLITIEADPAHAAFARRSFEEAGVADRVKLIEGEGLEELPKLAERFGERSIDLLFLDAVKTEYQGYLDAIRQALKPGALVIADNALGGSSWWVPDRTVDERDEGNRASLEAMDAFNRRLASDSAFETTLIPMRDGVLVARVV